MAAAYNPMSSRAMRRSAPVRRVGSGKRRWSCLSPWRPRPTAQRYQVQRGDPLRCRTLVRLVLAEKDVKDWLVMEMAHRQQRNINWRLHGERETFHASFGCLHMATRPNWTSIMRSSCLSAISAMGARTHSFGLVFFEFGGVKT